MMKNSVNIPLQDYPIPGYSNICLNKRERKLSQAVLTSMDHISNINCGKAFYCALHFNRTFRSSKINFHHNRLILIV